MIKCLFMVRKLDSLTYETEMYDSHEQALFAAGEWLGNHFNETGHGNDDMAGEWGNTVESTMVPATCPCSEVLILTINATAAMVVNFQHAIPEN